MPEEKIKIIDESGDKKYFTQLPSIVLNHSTANDQALYWQMKRYAGENGQCFATQETLMKKLGIGKWAYRKSLNYLLKKKWIKYIGMTNGKTRPIKTYAIVDIWRLNIMEYEKISPRVAVSFKQDKQEIPSSLAGDTSQIGSKIPSSLAIEEEPYKEYLIKNIYKISKIENFADKQPNEINLLIEKFKQVNPTYERLYPNKSQRDSLCRLLKQFGYDQVEKMIDGLSSIFGKPYAPRITTPYQLEQKLADYISFIKQKSEEKIPFLDLTKNN